MGLVLAVGLSGCPGKPPLEGQWEGTLSLGLVSMPMRFTFTRSGGGFTGQLEGTKAKEGSLPVDRVDLQGRQVTLEVKSLRATYSGTLSADGKQITGDWKQLGMTQPLTLTRPSK